MVGFILESQVLSSPIGFPNNFFLSVPKFLSPYGRAFSRGNRLGMVEWFLIGRPLEHAMKLPRSRYLVSWCFGSIHSIRFDMHLMTRQLFAETRNAPSPTDYIGKEWPPRSDANIMYESNHSYGLLKEKEKI